MDIESKINRINMLKEERRVERDEMRWPVKDLEEELKAWGPVEASSAKSPSSQTVNLLS